MFIFYFESLASLCIIKKIAYTVQKLIFHFQTLKIALKTVHLYQNFDENFLIEGNAYYEKFIKLNNDLLFKNNLCKAYVSFESILNDYSSENPTNSIDEESNSLIKITKPVNKYEDYSSFSKQVSFNTIY